jgi:hypothetical protein
VNLTRLKIIRRSKAVPEARYRLENLSDSNLILTTENWFEGYIWSTSYLFRNIEANPLIFMIGAFNPALIVFQGDEMLSYNHRSERTTTLT